MPSMDALLPFIFQLPPTKNFLSRTAMTVSLQAPRVQSPEGAGNYARAEAVRGRDRGPDRGFVASSSWIDQRPRFLAFVSPCLNPPPGLRRRGSTRPPEKSTQNSYNSSRFSTSSTSRGPKRACAHDIIPVVRRSLATQ